MSGKNNNLFKKKANIILKIFSFTKKFGKGD